VTVQAQLRDGRFDKDVNKRALEGNSSQGNAAVQEIHLTPIQGYDEDELDVQPN